MNWRHGGPSPPFGSGGRWFFTSPHYKSGSSPAGRKARSDLVQRYAWQAGDKTKCESRSGSGSSWCVVLYLGRWPQNGRKVYKWITFPSRREAEAALPKLLAQIGVGASLPPQRLTVGMFMEQWL